MLNFSLTFRGEKTLDPGDCTQIKRTKIITQDNLPAKASIRTQDNLPYYTSHLRITAAGVVLPKATAVGYITMCANSWLNSQKLQRSIQ